MVFGRRDSTFRRLMVGFVTSTLVPTWRCASIRIRPPAAAATQGCGEPGLVERRGQSLDGGLARLRGALRELAEQDLTLDELCEELLEQMLPTHPDDDVAPLAGRLHP